MLCTHCQQPYHGIELTDEAWRFTYCSEKCLRADSKMKCPGCHGWGYEHRDKNGQRVDEAEDYEAPCQGEGYVDKEMWFQLQGFEPVSREQRDRNIDEITSHFLRRPRS